jgi:AcrR family transcriptional regulator
LGANTANGTQLGDTGKMNAGRKVVEKRLGRPPATDSGDTKRRILDIAREMFSVHGYEVATNRDIATAAGITSGALYHYFGSKLDLYLAVHEDVQAGVYESFSNATMNLETFTEMFLAVLEVAHDICWRRASRRTTPSRDGSGSLAAERTTRSFFDEAD